MQRNETAPDQAQQQDSATVAGSTGAEVSGGNAGLVFLRRAPGPWQRARRCEPCAVMYIETELVNGGNDPCPRCGAFGLKFGAAQALFPEISLGRQLLELLGLAPVTRVLRFQPYRERDE